MSGHQREVTQGRRFEFGYNWKRFLSVLSDERISTAEESLTKMLEVADLNGKRFLDIGSGSGLFSLAARRLGAHVHSFDYDPTSVACTRELKRRYFPGDSRWVIEEGSALDADYLSRLGQFDVVYSWGVLHHTGDMWRALANLLTNVSRGGQLFVAVYNDQGRNSGYWKHVKRSYNRMPSAFRWIILGPAFIRLWGPTTIRDIVKQRPFSSWRNKKADRGMSPMIDVIDWVGGWPFEVAKPEQIFNFYRKHGFELTALKTCAGGHGCNEFVFSHTANEL